MKLILIILIAILLYWVIGFLITALMTTLEFLDNEGEFFFAVNSLCWPCFAFVLFIYLLWLLVKFIGIKISILPVAIVAYIKGEVEKKEENK